MEISVIGYKIWIVDPIRQSEWWFVVLDWVWIMGSLSNLVWLWEYLTVTPIASHLLDDGLQMYLQPYRIVASKCFSDCTWCWHQSVSPNALDYCDQVWMIRPPSSSPHWLNHNLQLSMIMASPCIFKQARLWPPTASLSSLNHRLQAPLHSY